MHETFLYINVATFKFLIIYSNNLRIHLETLFKYYIYDYRLRISSIQVFKQWNILLYKCPNTQTLKMAPKSEFRPKNTPKSKCNS